MQGKKNQFGEDLPMEIRTHGWEIPTNQDTCEIVEAIMDNEERIYPRHLRGKKRKALGGCDLFVGVLNKVLTKYDYQIVDTKNPGSLEEQM